MHRAHRRAAHAEPEFGYLDRGSWKFEDHAVMNALAMIDESSVIPTIEQWREEERERLGRHAGGATPTFSDRALFVAMVLAAVHHMPMLATCWTDILFRHISSGMRRELDLDDPPAPDDEKEWSARYRCVRYRFHALLAPIDPSPLPKNRWWSPDDFDARIAQRLADEQLDDQVLDERADRLAWVINAILEVSIRLLPREIRRRWNGSVALDATNVPAFAQADRLARGNAPRNKRQVRARSPDPDAGLYTRTTIDGEAKSAGNQRRLREAVWAYEASIVVAGPDGSTPDIMFPSLVVGMAPLHRPGAGISHAALVSLTSIIQRGHPARYLAADRAYTNAVPDAFQLRARALGYELVLDYRKDQLGVQDSYAGALMIEGDWYSPGIFTQLITATIDFRAGRIDENLWRQRIEARRDYRLRSKANPDAGGHVRRMCPAAGFAPVARCDLKPASLERAQRGKTRILVTDALASNPPQICTQESVTFPPDAGAKLAQPLLYGSPEWERTYHGLRNTVEGMNGIAKDGAAAALGDPSRRRIRGVAAQSLIVALLLMATNVARIDAYLATAQKDADGVHRKRRKRRRTTRDLSEWAPETPARSGAPPG